MNTWLAILFLLIAPTTTAAVRQIDPMPLTAKEKAKDSDQPKARCVKPHMFVLAIKTPDGQRIAVKTNVVFRPC